MKTFKSAHAHGGEPATLVLENPLPPVPPGSGWEKIWHKAIDAEANIIAQFLIEHLPGGVLAHLTVKLLQEQANLLTIKTPSNVPAADL